MLFNINFKEYCFSGKLSILLWSQVDKANKFKLGKHNLLLAGVSDNLSSVSVELVKQLCFPRVTVHLIMSAAPHLQFFFCLCLWSCCLCYFQVLSCLKSLSFMEDSCVHLPLYLLYIGNIMELRDLWDLPLLQRGVYLVGIGLFEMRFQCSRGP